MRLPLALLSYVLVTAAAAAAAGGLLLHAVQPTAALVAAEGEATPVAPRIQAWLDRKAEGLIYDEKAKAAALAEKERAASLRIRIPTAAEYAAAARAREKAERAAEKAAERERAAESGRREARRRPREVEPQAAYGALAYSPESRRPAYPRELLSPRSGD